MLYWIFIGILIVVSGIMTFARLWNKKPRVLTPYAKIKHELMERKDAVRRP